MLSSVSVSEKYVKYILLGVSDGYGVEYFVPFVAASLSPLPLHSNIYADVEFNMLIPWWGNVGTGFGYGKGGGWKKTELWSSRKFPNRFSKPWQSRSSPLSTRPCCLGSCCAPPRRKLRLSGMCFPFTTVPSASFSNPFEG